MNINKIQSNNTNFKSKVNVVQKLSNNKLYDNNHKVHVIQTFCDNKLCDAKFNALKKLKNDDRYKIGDNGFKHQYYLFGHQFVETVAGYEL